VQDDRINGMIIRQNSYLRFAFMKRIIGCLFICLICSSNHSKAQSITMSPDSVRLLLCKQWEMNYFLLGGAKIGTAPGEKIYFDFKPDNTFLTYDSHGSAKTAGTWSFDPKKKLIVLMINGKHDFITSLKDGEYEQLVQTEKGTPETKIVYKIKGT
jgi:hypothetical protein